jgi:HK97 family phage major capsid protein
MQDMNRASGSIVLPEDVSGEILSKVLETSVVQRAARRIALPGRGTAVNIITGEPTASWVGETEEKTVSNPSAQTKILRPYKMAVIETFSNEFRRDLPALYSALASRLPNALAKKFDQSVFFGAAPGSDFDTLAGVDTETLDYDGLVAALGKLGAAGYDMNGVIISPQGEANLLALKDLQDRPLFINQLQTEGSIGSVLGRPVFKSKAAYNAGSGVVGFTGDWTQAIWGQVDDVTVKISDQATLKVGDDTINLFQQNMFAVLAEIEVGFRISDDEAFIGLTASGS